MMASACTTASGSEKRSADLGYRQQLLVQTKTELPEFLGERLALTRVATPKPADKAARLLLLSCRERWDEILHSCHSRGSHVEAVILGTGRQLLGFEVYAPGEIHVDEPGAAEVISAELVWVHTH